MKYRIIGADRETGQDVCKTVEAGSLEMAESRARKTGVLIERIEQVEPSAPPPQAPIAELAAALQDAVPRTAPGGPNQKQTFHTKVRGVTHKTRTGENRQDVIAGCFPGERLSLVREPENRYDPKAIMVVRSNGQHIGYISAELAAQLAPIIDQGIHITAHVSNVTGGGRKNRGLNLRSRSTPLAPTLRQNHSNGGLKSAS